MANVPSTCRRVGVFLVVLLALGAADLAHRLPPLSAAAAAPVPRCVCSRGASVAEMANYADLLAIGTADGPISRRLPNGEHVTMYRLRLIRAWRWPGRAPTPPQHVDVYSLDFSSCSGHVGRDEPYVVQAKRVSVARIGADTLLSLAGRCSLEGPADTAGPFGTMLRTAYGEELFRGWARRRAAELDSIRLVLGPGVEPAP